MYIFKSHTRPNFNILARLSLQVGVFRHEASCETPRRKAPCHPYRPELPPLSAREAALRAGELQGCVHARLLSFPQAAAVPPGKLRHHARLRVSRAPSPRASPAARRRVRREVRLQAGPNLSLGALALTKPLNSHSGPAGVPPPTSPSARTPLSRSRAQGDTGAARRSPAQPGPRVHRPRGTPGGGDPTAAAGRRSSGYGPVPKLPRRKVGGTARPCGAGRGGAPRSLQLARSANHLAESTARSPARPSAAPGCSPEAARKVAAHPTRARAGSQESGHPHACST